MKTFVRSLLCVGVLAVGANGLFAAQKSTWFDQWYRAKYGRSSPAEEARQKAENANTAFREEPSAIRPANTLFEDWYRAKYGHPSPREEARLKAERASTAFREEPASAPTRPANTWFEDWYKAKYGRPSPLASERK